jgi:hypothetical protein
MLNHHDNRCKPAFALVDLVGGFIAALKARGHPKVGFRQSLVSSREHLKR